MGNDTENNPVVLPEVEIIVKEPGFRWQRYRKLIPAVIGVVVLIGMDYLKIERLPGMNEMVLEWFVAAATVFGIERTPNSKR